MIRYLFGFSGDALTAGAVNPSDCTRCTAMDIEGYLQNPGGTLNQALLGPLASAEIRAYRLSDLDTPVEGPLSAGASLNDLITAGTFALELNGIDGQEWILVSAAGGQDIDADNNGVADTNPTENLGTLYGLATAKQWRDGGVKLTALSDMAWRFTRSLVGEVSPSELYIRLNELAQAFILEDLNGDGGVDRHDLLAFVPHAGADLAKLNFDYRALFATNDQGQSVISAHHAGNRDLLEQLLNTQFGHAFNLWAARDDRYELVAVEVNLFGRGKVTADQGGLSVDSETDPAVTQSSIWATRDDTATVTLTATPIAETELRGWIGCDEISPDAHQCTVRLDRSRYVIATFDYLTTTYHGTVHDLTGATVVLEPSRVNVTIPPAQTELVNRLATVQVGDFIVGPTARGGYLRKVNDIVKLDDHTYQLTTEEAGLPDVIAQGSGGFRRALTNGDILGYVPRSAANSRARVADNAIRALEGVKLIPSDDPNDTTIRLQLGAPLEDDRPDARVRHDLKVTLWEYEDKPRNEKQTPSVQGILDVEVVPDIDYHFGTWGIFSGLKDFRLTQDVKQSGTLKFTLESSKTHWATEGTLVDDPRIKIAEIPFGKFGFTIGVVPVWVTPNVSIYLSASGQVKASLSMGGTFQEQRLIGVTYKKDKRGIGHWDHINTPLVPVTFKPDAAPVVNFDAELKGAAEASIQLEVYDVTGPRVGAEGSLALQAAIPVFNGDILTGKGCQDGIEASLKAGFKGFVLWSVSADIRELFAKKTGVEFLSYLPSFEYSFLSKEWLLWHDYLTGQCADDPPFLTVDGDDIYETVAYPDRGLVAQRYVLTNVGSGKLPWAVKHRNTLPEDAAMTVNPSKSSSPDEELVADELVYVDVMIDTTKLELGTYRNALHFENTFATGEWQTARPDGDTVQMIDIEIVPGLTDTPVITDVDDQEGSFAKVHWSFNPPATPELWGYAIEVTSDPTGQTGWARLATVTNIEATSRVVSGLANGEVCFRMLAYGAGKIKTPYSAVNCVTLSAEPNRLDLTLGSGANIAENGSLTGTLSRNSGTAALTVLLASSDPDTASVPGILSIPAGQSSAEFTLTAADNAMADGDRIVTITASAADYERDSRDVTVADDDIATLFVSLAKASIDETDEGTNGTVSHNADTGTAVTVDLSSSDTSEATVPVSVTIPAGASSVDFAVTAKNDSTSDGDQNVTLSASATDFADGTAGIVVTDDDSHTGPRLLLDRVVFSKAYHRSDSCPPAEEGATQVCIEYEYYASGWDIYQRYTHSQGSGSYNFTETYRSDGYVASDYSMTMTYDSPPATLIPGEPVPTLTASGTASGYTKGWYLNISLTYYVKSGSRNSYIYDGQVSLSNRELPYENGVFRGTLTKSATTDITVPSSAGDGYTIGSKFNWDPGLYVDWIYRLKE